MGSLEFTTSTSVESTISVNLSLGFHENISKMHQPAVLHRYEVNTSVFSTSLPNVSSVVEYGNTTNVTETEFSMGLSEESLIVLMVLYSLTTVLSIGGNSLVVLVFFKGRRSRTDLRLFLINLAAADLVMAVFCMPFTFADTILGHWVFTKPMCPIVLFMQLFSVAASVFTNMAIGVDRFMAVSFPLKSRITYRRGKYVIVIIWMSSLLLSTVMLAVGRGIDDGSGNVKCMELWPVPDQRKTFTICVLLFTYIMPLAILLITYSIVGILLWKRTTPGNKHANRDMHQLRTKIKVVKMLVIVVVMFGICWLPIHAFTLFIDSHPELLATTEDIQFFMGIYLTAHWLAMSNSFANPIIYGFTNASFRADMAVLLNKWFPCCCCFKHMMTRTYSLSNYDSIIYRKHTVIRGGSMKNSTGTSDSFKRSRPVQYFGDQRKEFPGFRRTRSEMHVKRITVNGVQNGHVYSFKSPSTKLNDSVPE
ncbi:prolactin-releasing peptide receptor-like [Mizuhopecten yessoensis]|uniref:prolactin-releasing peptide receptor-like n=1 Tax=Mizuhopecten yessoensis TaxID=6573 RepID=UPI000B45C487|nr:prolactin-releasing peptide receptor-like [Mizuhopecten yessoensis]